MSLRRAILTVAVGLPAFARPYDPPCPTLSQVVAASRVLFVGRVLDSRETSRGDGTDATASLEVECCLVGDACKRGRIQVTYRARGGSDERDMAVGLAAGQRYLIALASSSSGPRIRIDTYAAKDLVFEFESLPEYREERTSRIRTELPWRICAAESVTFDDLAAMAMKNRDHAVAPMCTGSATHGTPTGSPSPRPRPRGTGGTR